MKSVLILTLFVGGTFAGEINKKKELKIDEFDRMVASGLKNFVDQKSGLPMFFDLSIAADGPEAEALLDRRQGEELYFLCGESISPFLDYLESMYLTEKARHKSEPNGFNRKIECKNNICGYLGNGEWDQGLQFYFSAKEDGFQLKSVTYLDPVSMYDLDKQLFGYFKGVNCVKRNKKINTGLLRVCNTSKDRKPGLPLREAPTWKKSTKTIRSGSQMLDGTILVDLKHRKGKWIAVQHLPSGDKGWVISVNTDRKNTKNPVVCPLGSM